MGEQQEIIPKEPIDFKTTDGRLHMIELFSGIGAQAMAMKQLGIPFESICCEIDEKAYKSYCAIHGPTPNLGDITKVEHLPPCDLLFYSFPCQDISMAGKQGGFSEGSGTRSSLLWDVGRLLIDMKHRDCLPMTLIMENVKALVFKKNMEGFQKWIDTLTEMGYTSEWQVLNAKDYGTPQNRERVFMVSRLDGQRFIFPEPHPDGRVLKDVLEDDVPEKYYLSQEKIAHYEQHRVRQEENGRGFGWKPTDGSKEAHALTGNQTRHTQNFVIEDFFNGNAAKKSGNSRTGMIIDGHLDKPFVSDTYVYRTEGMSPTSLGERSNCNARIRVDGPIMAGNLNNDTAFGQANDVHSIDGSAPTITTCHVGQPKIEVNERILAGDLHNKEWLDISNRVHSVEGISPTVCTLDNNTKPKIEVTGDLHREGHSESKNRVYGTDGISPTVMTPNGGGVTPRIEVKGVMNNSKVIQDRQVYGDDGVSPSVIGAGGSGIHGRPLPIQQSEEEGGGQTRR